MKKFLLILLAFLLTAAMVCTLAACDDDPAEHTHDYGTLIPETPADCGTNGRKAHYECNGCDKLFVDDNGEKKEVSASELVIPATGQHDYAGQPFVSGGASGHHQLCKVCGTPNADVAHDSFTYTPVSGQRQHTKKCGVCNYEVTENCTVEGNECTLCHADYTPVVGNDETITVHFHPTEWWNAAQLKLYAWYGDGQSTVYPLGAFPGGADFQADTDNTGWYTYTFQVPEGHRGTDLYIIVNDKVSTVEDTYDGVQTGNINVTATELWVAGIVNTEQFYTSPQDATAAEANVPGKDAWIVVGSFTTPGWQNPASTKDNVFVDNKVTVQLAANAEFKVAKNGSWADETTFGYGRYTVSKDAAVSGDISGLLVEGKNEKDEPNGNIVVKYACTLEITLDTANNEHPLSIVVKEATGLPAETDAPDSNEWIVLGSFTDTQWQNPTQSWDYVLKQADGYKLTLQFAAKDQFKITKNDGTWAGAVTFGFDSMTYTFVEEVTGDTSKLFTKGQDNDYNNIIVNYACKLEITFTPSTGAIAIKILEAPELPEIDDTKVTKYYLVGEYNGKRAWDDASGDALTYDSATQTYSITVSFKVGDQWKVKRETVNPTADDSWDYGINGGDMATKFTFNYGSITQPSKPLFEGSDNITVNHNCTVTITYKPSNDTTVITVTALTENKESYTYTFYFYAGSSRSKMQIHAWSNEPTGAPQFGTDWNGSEMDNVSGYWWKWSITSSVNWDGKEFSVIFHVGDTKIQWLNSDETKNGLSNHPTKVYLAREMYFTNTDYTQWFESAEEAGHPMTVAAVAPVQVATVPQSISKSYLDYALAA